MLILIPLHKRANDIHKRRQRMSFILPDFIDESVKNGNELVILLFGLRNGDEIGQSRPGPKSPIKFGSRHGYSFHFPSSYSACVKTARI